MVRNAVDDEMPVVDTGAQQAVFDRIMADARAQLAEKRVKHVSEDGAVTVTVDGNGAVLSLDLARGLVRTTSPEAAGLAIQDAVNVARGEAGRRGRRLVYRAFAEDPEFTLFEVAEEALA